MNLGINAFLNLVLRGKLSTKLNLPTLSQNVFQMLASQNVSVSQFLHVEVITTML